MVWWDSTYFEMSIDERTQLRKDAARLLFAYTFELRYRRPPNPWDWTLGWALISGEVEILRSVEEPLAPVYKVAHDVRQALDLVEKSS